jgi:hypothetical protein
VTDCVAPAELARIQPTRLRDLPAFLGYTVVHLARVALSYYVYRSNRAPTAWFWAAEAVDVSLGILVIYEIHCHVFRNYAALRRFSRVLVQWCAAILILVATIPAAGSTNWKDCLTATMVVVGWCVALLKPALLLLLFRFSSFDGLPWSHYLLAMVIGMGAYTSVDVLGLTLQRHSALLPAAVNALVTSAAFNCSVLVWVVYFLTQGRSGTMVSGPNDEMETWNSILDVLLGGRNRNLPGG